MLCSAALASVHSPQQRAPSTAAGSGVCCATLIALPLCPAPPGHPNHHKHQLVAACTPSATSQQPQISCSPPWAAWQQSRTRVGSPRSLCGATMRWVYAKALAGATGRCRASSCAQRGVEHGQPPSPPCCPAPDPGVSEASQVLEPLLQRGEPVHAHLAQPWRAGHAGNRVHHPGACDGGGAGRGRASFARRLAAHSCRVPAAPCCRPSRTR